MCLQIRSWSTSATENPKWTKNLPASSELQSYGSQQKKELLVFRETFFITRAKLDRVYKYSETDYGGWVLRSSWEPPFDFHDKLANLPLRAGVSIFGGCS